jgi:Protein of unknown function, DUF481
MGSFARRVLSVALLLGLPATVDAQGRTDIVTLGNGDRITGEILRLKRGRLEFKTDDAGTLYLEWDKLSSVLTVRTVEVGTGDGMRYLGSLVKAATRTISVSMPGGEVPLQMPDVTWIAPIGQSFWSKLDGSIDAGFNYTQSSGVGQMSLNSDSVFRQPESHVRLIGSMTLTQTEDDDRDDRATLDMSYQDFRWQRWFILGFGRFETNESLGLTLRSQVGAAVGPRLVNSNRAQVSIGAGVDVNDERGVDVESTRNVEAILLFQTSYFTYDRPTTNLDFRVQYYPSLSDRGRQRLQLDTSIKQELLKDLFVALTVYDSYDNRPPNAAADRNDIGIVASIGWTY